MELGIGLRDAIIGNEVGKNAAEARARQEELDAQARTDWAAKNEETQDGLETARAKHAVDIKQLPKSIGPGSAQAQDAGLAALRPGVSLTQAAVDSVVGEAAQPSLSAGAPKPAVNAQSAGLEYGAPTSASIASLYNAEKDDRQRAELYNRYQAARSVERASAARKAQMMLEADDPTGAVELYNTTIHDGRKAVSAKPKDANTLLVTFDDGKVQEVSKVGLHKFLIELQKPGSQVDASIKALEERSKADANIYQAEGDGNKELRLAQAAKARAEGADGGGDAPAEAKLVNYYIKTHGMSKEDARKFVKSSKESSPEAHKAKLIASVSANAMMSAKQKQQAITEGSALIDGLYGASHAAASPAAPANPAEPAARKYNPETRRFE